MGKARWTGMLLPSITLATLLFLYLRISCTRLVVIHLYLLSYILSLLASTIQVIRIPSHEIYIFDIQVATNTLTSVFSGKVKVRAIYSYVDLQEFLPS